MSQGRGNGFGRGAAAGVCLSAAAALLVAAGTSSEPSYHVTSSADGRVAHLWMASGAELQYVSSAEMPRGRSDEKAGREDKGEDAEDERGVKPAKADPQRTRPKGKPGGG